MTIIVGGEDPNHTVKRDEDKARAEAKEWAEKGLIMECEILKCDEPMMSGNIYPRKVVEAALSEIAPHIARGEVLGEFEPEETSTRIMLKGASHVVDKLELQENGAVLARVRLIPTDSGKALVKYIRDGGIIKMAPRGFGNSVDGKIEGYQIVTVDIYRDEEEEDEDDDAS